MRMVRGWDEEMGSINTRTGYPKQPRLVTASHSVHAFIDQFGDDDDDRSINRSIWL